MPRHEGVLAGRLAILYNLGSGCALRAFALDAWPLLGTAAGVRAGLEQQKKMVMRAAQAPIPQASMPLLHPLQAPRRLFQSRISFAEGEANLLGALRGLTVEA